MADRSPGRVRHQQPGLSGTAASAGLGQTQDGQHQEEGGGGAGEVGAEDQDQERLGAQPGDRGDSAGGEGEHETKQVRLTL